MPGYRDESGGALNPQIHAQQTPKQDGRGSLYQTVEYALRQAYPLADVFHDVGRAGVAGAVVAYVYAGDIARYQVGGRDGAEQVRAQQVCGDD